MKIAICDDDYEDLRLISQYLTQFDSSLSATEFSTATDLLKAYQKDFYDLIFLDIELGKLNGYDAAVQLMKREEKPLIIFTTKSSKYTIQGYGIAFRYLVKPIDYDTFSKTMALALENIIPQKIVFHIDGIMRVIPIKDITYFEVSNHTAIIHTTKKAFSSRCPLSEIMSQMEGCHFAQTHQSYYVNLAFVDHVGTNKIILTTEEEVRLSRNKRNAFFKLLGEYLRR